MYGPEAGAWDSLEDDQDSFLERFCVPALVSSQNPDGGWGYRCGAASSVEPTAWALLALLQKPQTDWVEKSAKAGVCWLRYVQLPDGAWPVVLDRQQGGWVAALACLALYAYGESEQLARGLQRLCNSWPAEGGYWWRFRDRVMKRGSVVRQDSSLRGWSWTPGTSSWVEPTSYSLLALRHVPPEISSRAIEKRRYFGESMLYDRMCPGGGWNNGNPVVYGVAGVPRVGPTVWALLALQDYRHRPENRTSLDWLEQEYPNIQGPGSLALAHLCLQVYDRPVPALGPRLWDLCMNNRFFHNILVIAWAAVALNPARHWL